MSALERRGAIQVYNTTLLTAGGDALENALRTEMETTENLHMASLIKTHKFTLK